MIEPYSKGDHGKNYVQKLKDEDMKRGWDAKGNKLVKNDKRGMKMPWQKKQE